MKKGEVFKGDQSNKKDLKNIIKKIKTSNFIIDDGSHVPEHQLFTFNYLFKNLLDYDGIYIIEDIETSYWKNADLYGYKIDSCLNCSNNIVKIFSDIVQIVNREFLSETDIEYIQKQSPINKKIFKYISFIMFGQNCIIIKKMSKYEYKKYGKRKYRFINKLGS